MYKIFFKMPILIVGVVILLGHLPQTLIAQGHHSDNHHNGMWADSLETITLEGKVSVDSTHSYPMYYLDVDDDNNLDYHLSFGPHWYQPGDGVTRPTDGDFISVEGIFWDMEDYPTVVVLSINGLEWRQIIEGGMTGWNGSQMWVDSLEVINIAGTIMVDSSYFYHHYYIDIDEDNTPDYLLNFGPPWYSPPSEAVRPSHGNKVTILGGLHLGHFGTISVMVYELNGEKWRESTGPHPWSGSWMHRDAVGSTTIYCPSDSLSWMNHPSGSMMGGMMFPDSLFCQFEEIHPEFVPGDFDSTLFACFYMNMFEPDESGMMNEMGSNGMMRFNLSTEFRFHYDELMINNINISDVSIQMKYWDEVSDQWKEVIDYELDPVNHTISFAGMDMYNYYGIFAYGNSLSVNEIDFTNQISNIKLFQNYPNPFTTETRINFILFEDQHITMTIYDLQGRKVKTLIENQLPAGNHSVTWNGSSDSQPVGPGNYILKIQSQNQVGTLNLVYKK